MLLEPNAAALEPELTEMVNPCKEQMLWQIKKIKFLIRKKVL